MAKIIVTGSTGFIGKKLVSRLLEEGHEVYALARKKVESKLFDHPNKHVIYIDFSDAAGRELLPKDIDAAYYLIHSMGHSVKNLIETEEKVTRNFLSAIERTNCKQIIFLSGIIESEAELSPHLESRLAVERILLSSKIPCTVLRSSIIIGTGSASFEIIRDLVERLPAMVAPKWVKSYCQPIAIRDVMFYLNGVLLNTLCFGRTYDIGGPEVLTFKEVLLRYAAFRNLKRFIFDVPVLTPKLSSYWLVFISAVNFSICRYLVESMRHHTRKLNKTIDDVLPHQCLPYEEAIELACRNESEKGVRV